MKFSLNDDIDDEDGELVGDDSALYDNKKDMNDNYNVEKVNDTLLEIASTIIEVKNLYN